MPNNTFTPLFSYTATGNITEVVFSSIPQDYAHLELHAHLVSSTGNSYPRIRLNGDSSSIYGRQSLGSGSSTASATRFNSENIAYFEGSLYLSTGSYGESRTHFNNYSATDQYKTFLSHVGSAGAVGGNTTELTVNTWRSNSAVTSITYYIEASAGSTFVLYGIKAEPAGNVGSKAIGGTVTTSGGYTYHAFTSTGMFETTTSITGAEVLVVGGGGGGGGNVTSGNSSGGGGAGGFRTGSSLSLSGNYAVIIGAGGAGGSLLGGQGSSGTDSIFSTITSTGGGNGSGSQSGSAGSGGSGGGAAYGVSAGSGNTPSTSPSQGNNGGTATYSGAYRGGGGGGAASAGANGVDSGNGGAGSNTLSAWASATGTGVSGYYAGGGGGGAYNGTAGVGGAGGAGNGGYTAVATSATANTGSGGGGGAGASSVSGTTLIGGNGGSGIVIVRYAS